MWNRSHNDGNCLSLGQRTITEEEAFKIVKTWLATEFEGGRHAVERLHARRRQVLPVGMQVDESRRHHVAAGVEDDLSGERSAGYRRDAVAAHPDPPHRIESGLGVDGAPVGDHELVAPPLGGERGRKRGQRDEGEEECRRSGNGRGSDGAHGVECSRRSGRQRMPPHATCRQSARSHALAGNGGSQTRVTLGAHRGFPRWRAAGPGGIVVRDPLPRPSCATSRTPARPTPTSARTTMRRATRNGSGGTPPARCTGTWRRR
ncbi:MAG: RpiB/LacA/LacB family sugar-phosphate isomerase [Gemmatimonadota bacterium]